MITLNTLAKSKTKKARKRVGRGNGSGHGTYSTRGCKGQRARSGGRKRLKLKGFKKILASIPKNRGFKRDGIHCQIINLECINRSFKDGDNITKADLLGKGLISKGNLPVKILAKGELRIKNLHVKECLLSSKAKQAIEKMGGQIITF